MKMNRTLINEVDIGTGEARLFKQAKDGVIVESILSVNTQDYLM